MGLIQRGIDWLANKVAHQITRKSLEDLVISRASTPFDVLMSRGWSSSKTELIRAVTDWAYVAINTVSKKVGNSKWVIVKRTDHNVEIVKTHPVYEFLEQPNNNQTWNEILHLTSAHLNSAGIAYWWMSEDKGRPQLIVLRPDAMYDKGGSYLYTLGNARISIPAEEVCRFVMPSIQCPDGSDGQSPMSATAGIMQSYLGMRVAEWNSWRKAVIDELIVKFDSGVSEAPARKILQEIGRLTGANNAGKLLGVTGVAGTERIGLSPKDIVNPELASQFRREILAVWSVNEQVIGIDTNANRATSFTSQQRMVENAVAPMLEMIAAKINHRMTPWYWAGDLIYFVPIIPYPEDWERALEEDTKLASAGIVTINEIRTKRGYEEVEWGDLPLVPFNVAPLSVTQEQEQTQPKSAEKNIDPRDEKSRRFSDIFVRFHSRYEKTFADAMRTKVFKPIIREYRERLSKKNVTTVKTHPLSQSYLEEQMYELYRSIVVDGAGKRYAEAVADSFGLSFNLDQWRPVYERFAKLRGREFWHEIIDRSRIVAEQAIQDAVADKIDFATALSRIETEYGEPRALRIARTETAGAMNGGAMSVYKMNGIRGKRWIASLDDLVRPSHREAHGQVVPINQSFIVGGEELDHPGDPSGSPGEIINCRCALAPSTDVEE